MKAINKIYSFIIKYGVYILALGGVVLTVSLAFDNVVWGDEAFSGNIIRGTGFAGIYERIYYWENHPPLYYFYLKVISLIFGWKTSSFHLASIFCYIVSIAAAVTLFKKKFGSIATAFFIVITSFTATCAEYNQEIRMYELCFMFVVFCTYFSIRIIEDIHSKRYWVGIVLCGVGAAYSHYYGLVTTGILLFATSLFAFIKYRKKTWLYGVVSIVSYLALYSPWLVIFVKQLKMVKASWWIERPSTLSEIITFMFGAGKAFNFVFALTIFASLLAIVAEVYLIQFRPQKKLSDEMYYFLTLWFTLVMVLCFGYFMCVVYNPILIARYTHPLIPIAMGILMISVRQLIDLFAFFKDGEEKGNVQDKELGAVKTEIGLTSIIMLFVIFLVIFGTALFDFKYYRSVSKTQNVETNKILEMVGTPGEDTVFTSLAVPHLAWTVLQYYYPDNEVFNEDPTSLDGESSEIWAFMGYELSETGLEIMKEKGYTNVEYYPDMHFGKYNTGIYHFTK